MRLIDQPIPRQWKKVELDMIQGNISRLCVSDDPEEIIVQLGFAIDRLSMLAYSRVKELKEESENV